MDANLVAGAEFWLNRARVPPFLVNSLPKSGTNLLEKAVSLFPGVRRAPLSLDHRVGVSLGGLPGEEDCLPLGVGSPVLAARSAVREHLRRASRASYVFSHVPYSPPMVELIGELRYKSLLILRDPRDVALSLARYIPTAPDNRLFPYFQPLSQPERLTAALAGLAGPEGPILVSMKEQVTSVLHWREQPVNYTTYFELLVGPQGGGTRAAQIGELERIARHLGIACSRSHIHSMADRLFGGTPTFSRGMIGAWRDQYTVEQKYLAKQQLGLLLIELGYERDLNW